MLFLRSQGGKTCALAFSPDGSRLASGGADRRVHVWDAASGKAVAVSDRNLNAYIYAVAFSPAGVVMASGSGRRNVRVLHAATCRMVLVGGGHRAQVTALAFSADGKKLFSSAGDPSSAGVDGEVIRWGVYDGMRQLGRLEVPGGAWALALAPDGSRLAVGDGRGSVTLLSPTLKVKDVLANRASIRSVAFSPDGRLLAAASGWSVRVWDLEGNRLAYTLTGHTNVVWSVAFTPDGRTLLSAGRDGSVRLWDVDSGRLRDTLDWQIGKLRAVAVSPDGTKAAAAGDGPVVLWDLDL